MVLMDIFKLTEQELLKSIEKGYDSEYIRIRLGRIFREKGDTAKSINEFKQAAQLSERKNFLWFQNFILNEIEISQKKHFLESRPRGLIVSLTNKCNIRCIMCEVWNDPWDISLKTVHDIKKILPYLQYVTWSGGEPFLSKYFKELFSHSKNIKGLEQTIVTNGLLIDDIWAKELADSNTKLIISIDGITKSIYEKIRIGSSFEKLQYTLQLLNKYAGPESTLEIIMQMVVMEENYTELENIIDFLKKYNIKRLCIIPLNDSVNNDNTFYQRPDISTYLTDIINRITSAANNNNIRIVNAIPIISEKLENNTPAKKSAVSPENADLSIPCLWPWQQMTISSQEKISIHCFCVHFSIGNLAGSNLFKIWNNKNFQNLRKKIIKNKHKEICNHSCISGAIEKKALQIDY